MIAGSPIGLLLVLTYAESESVNTWTLDAIESTIWTEEEL